MLSRLLTLLTASLRQAFAADFPEIFEVACCFVTLFRSYTDGQELTGTYNANYLRTYDTWGVAGTPPTVRVTPDTFRHEELRRKAWPHRSMSTAPSPYRHGSPPWPLWGRWSPQAPGCATHSRKSRCAAQGPIGGCAVRQ